MNLKILLCHWIASRIEARSRAQRRALRDHHRYESLEILALEQRSRGLRLYAAWAQHPEHNSIREALSGRPVPQATSEILLHKDRERAFC